jgi:hypothetical protein
MKNLRPKKAVMCLMSEVVLGSGTWLDISYDALIEKGMKISGGLIIQILYIAICYFSSSVFGGNPFKKYEAIEISKMEYGQTFI